jgi:hypothetical protein
MATMPLHAITSTYGEEGLRARFAVEIEKWPEPDQRRLNRALDLAARLHGADRRERDHTSITAPGGDPDHVHYSVHGARQARYTTR